MSSAGAINLLHHQPLPHSTRKRSDVVRHSMLWPSLVEYLGFYELGVLCEGTCKKTKYFAVCIGTTHIAASPKLGTQSQAYQGMKETVSTSFYRFAFIVNLK